MAMRPTASCSPMRPRIACCWRYSRATRRIRARSVSARSSWSAGSAVSPATSFASGSGGCYGARLLGRYPRFERPVQTAVRLADRHYVWMILFHRFPHGIRGLAGFAYGISRLPWSTFLALNFVAAGLWSGAVVSAGYAFGQFSENVHQQCLLGPGHCDAGRVSRPVLAAQQKARPDRGAVLKQAARHSGYSQEAGRERRSSTSNHNPII